MPSNATDYDTFVLTLNPQVTFTDIRKPTDDHMKHKDIQRVKKRRANSVVYSVKGHDNGQEKRRLNYWIMLIILIKRRRN